MDDCNTFQPGFQLPSRRDDSDIMPQGRQFIRQPQDMPFDTAFIKLGKYVNYVHVVLHFSMIHSAARFASLRTGPSG